MSRKINKKLLEGLWYHGDRNKTNFFNRKFDAEDHSRDRNSTGPGIYFTRDEGFAKGFAHPNGWVYTVRVSLDPSRVLLDDTRVDVSRLRAFVEACEDDGLLANYGFPRQRGIMNAVALNGDAPNMLDAVLGVYNDLYQMDSVKYARMMSEIGYDALLHRPNPENLPDTYHLVVYDPKTIEIIKEERYGTQLERRRVSSFKQFVNENGATSPGDAMADWRFLQWFGDSKVVDGSGAPKILYHGTKSKFDVFRVSRSTGNHGETDQIEGIYFTDSREGASFFSLSDERYLMPVYLSLKNPYIVDGYADLRERLGVKKMADVNKILKDRGYDGLIVKNGFYANGGPFSLYLAFHPNQAKSVHNDGTWDASDDNIHS